MASLCKTCGKHESCRHGYRDMHYVDKCNDFETKSQNECEHCIYEKTQYYDEPCCKCVNKDLFVSKKRNKCSDCAIYFRCPLGTNATKCKYFESKDDYFILN